MRQLSHSDTLHLPGSAIDDSSHSPASHRTVLQPKGLQRGAKGGFIWSSCNTASSCVCERLTMALQSPIWGRENIAPPNALLPVSGLPNASMSSAAPITRPLGFTLSTSSANSGCPAASKSVHNQSAH